MNNFNNNDLSLNVERILSQQNRRSLEDTLNREVTKTEILDSKNMTGTAQTQQDFVNKIRWICEPDPMTIGAVFAAVNLISNSIAQMPWEVKSIKGKEIQSNLYLNHLTDNMIQSRFLFVKNLVKDALVYGNGYAFIHRDEDGYPVSLQYLTPQQCTPYVNSTYTEIYYSSPLISSSRRYIPKEDMIHLLMHSKDGLIGRGILYFARNVLRLSAATERALIDYFENDMTIQGVIRQTQPGRLLKDQREEIRAQWRKPKDNIRILENGMEYQAIQSNSREAEMQQNRLFNLQEIARFFNISPVLLGDLSHTTYSSVESAQLEFQIHTLAPWVVGLEDELNRKLIYPSDKKKYYIDIDEAAIITMDNTTTSNLAINQHKEGIRSTNEARDMLGLPRIDNDQADKLIIPYTDISQNIIGDTQSSDNSVYKDNSIDNMIKNRE